MTAKEKFEKISALIEEEIKQPHKSSSAISDEIAQKLGVSTRDLSTVFSSVRDTTLTPKAELKTR